MDFVAVWGNGNTSCIYQLSANRLPAYNMLYDYMYVCNINNYYIIGGNWGYNPLANWNEPSI